MDPEEQSRSSPRALCKTSSSSQVPCGRLLCGCLVRLHRLRVAPLPLVLVVVALQQRRRWRQEQWRIYRAEAAVAAAFACWPASEEG